jgi:outer membrane protein assembly factor BamB
LILFMENMAKPKSKWPLASRVAFLLALIIAVSLVAFGCVSGLAPVGWSGGMVSDGTLYVGSQYGQLVAVNLSDDSRLVSEALVPVSQPGLFGCSTSTGGGGCAGGSASVPIYGTPVVSGNLTYIAGYNGKVYAYNTSNLAVRWVYPREGNLSSIVGGIVVAQGKVLFGCTDGKVYALDAEFGDYLWESTATGDKIWGTPAFLEQTVYYGSTGETVNQDTLFIGSFDKKVYALNPGDGTVKWEYTTEGSVIATPLVFNSTVYIGSFDRNLYALNAGDGTLKWKFTGNNWFWAQPVVWNGIIYAGCLDGLVYALNADTGVEVKRFDLGSPVSSQPVIVEGSVIFVNRKGVVYSIDTGTNGIRQLADLKKTVNGPLAANEEIVYIHTQENVLQPINAVTGALLSPISLSS